MLPKQKRLSKEDFSHLFHHTRSFKGDFFVLRYVFPTAKEQKATVIVPKKIYKSAVSRNKYRRIVYTILGDIFTKKSAGVCCSVTITKQIPRMSFLEIKHTVETSFKQISFL